MTIEWIAKLSGFISFLSSDWLPDEKSNQELPKWISYFFCSNAEIYTTDVKRDRHRAGLPQLKKRTRLC